jgi:hypothetical protein
VTLQVSTRLACPPLYGTPRSSDRFTLGPNAGRVARWLGKPLHPWQQLIADVAGEIDPDTGYLAYDEVDVVVMRQQGKTELSLPLMAHRCTGFDSTLVDFAAAELGKLVMPPGPQTVLYTAQTADFAKAKWRDVHLARILGAPEVRRHLARPAHRYGGARLSNNQEAIFWRNGSMWRPGSTTGKTAGTGDTLDMPVIDEAWSRPDNRTELGLRPAMLTRPWRQLWVMSMVPGLSRAAPGTWKYLEHKMQVGKAKVNADVRKGTAFFLFGAADSIEQVDIYDEQVWWRSMPSLGLTVGVEAVRSDAEGMDPVDFAAEYLSIPPGKSAPRWKLIAQDTWAGLRDPLSTFAGPCALAVEVTEDRQRAWIVAAGKREDGHWHVEVVEPGFKIAAGAVGMDWVIPRWRELVASQPVVTTVIDKRRPAGSYVAEMKSAMRDVTCPTVQDVAGACGRFYDLSGQDADEASDDGVRVYHLGQPELDRAVAGASKVDQGNGAFVFVKRGTSAELGPLYGAALAVLGFEVKGAAYGKRSQIW